MNKFVILAFVASAIGAAVGEDWSDAAITVDTFNVSNDFNPESSKI